MSRTTQGKNKPNHGRVTIAYETDGDKSKNPNIPWVMGVMSDLSGSNSSELPDLEKRKYTEVSDTNFDEFLESQKPGISEKVENMLDGEGELSVDLTFESLDDFTPGRLAEKMDATSQLLEQRDRLEQAIRKMDGSKLGKEIASNLERLLEAEKEGSDESL